MTCVMQLRSQYILVSFILCCGLFLLTLTVYIPSLVSQVIAQRLAKELPIVNGSTFTEKWSRPEASVYVRFYLFNLTNLEQFEAGDKPIFNQLGPYTFFNKRHNIIHGWSEDDTLFEYETLKYYFFEPSLSNGSMDDVFVTANIPNAVIIYKADRVPFFLRGVISGSLKEAGEGFFVTTTVREFLVEGYETKSLAKLTKMKTFVEKVFTSSNSPIQERFGVLYKQNGTSQSGRITAYTGKHDIRKILSITKWNDKSSMKCWSDWGTCNQINGSDGSFFPPLSCVEKKPIQIFAPEFNRTLSIVYTGESDYKGVKTYVYKVPADTFSLSNPENLCFCTHNDTKMLESGSCSLYGVLDLSPCQPENAPLVLSSPHFLNAHPLLLEAIIGLKPQADLHESIIEIEPVTGTPMKVSKRVQLSIKLKSEHSVKGLPHYPDTIFPVFWLEESAEGGDKIVEALDSLLFSKLRMATYISIACGVIGVFSILTSLVMLLPSRYIKIFDAKRLEYSIINFKRS